MLKYKYIIKNTETILSNSTRKLLWLKTTIIAVFKNEFIVLFITIFGTLSFHICSTIAYACQILVQNNVGMRILRTIELW